MSITLEWVSNKYSTTVDLHGFVATASCPADVINIYLEIVLKYYLESQRNNNVFSDFRCPTYTSLPAGCQLVTQPGKCCAEPSCPGVHNVTIVTAPPSIYTPDCKLIFFGF